MQKREGEGEGEGVGEEEGEGEERACEMIGCGRSQSPLPGPWHRWRRGRMDEEDFHEGVA